MTDLKELAAETLRKTNTYFAALTAAAQAPSRTGLVATFTRDGYSVSVL